MSHEFINICRFYNNQLIIYRDFYDRKPRTEKQIENEKNLKDVKYKGYMSPKTRSKVKKYLCTWLDAVTILKDSQKISKLSKKPYLTFVTLTLPFQQLHTDNYIKRKLLTPFLQTLIRKYDVVNYFWRAEAQKNGNIHFHVICDSYIHWKFIRQEWNNLLEKHDYIDYFQQLHGHRNPNSTDIHKLGMVKNVSSYIIKYCTKDTGYRAIEGRIHGCSDRLKTIKPYECLMDEETEDFVRKVENLESSKVIVKDEFTVIINNIAKYLLHIKPNLYNNYKSYLFECLSDLYNKDSIKIKEKVFIEPPELVAVFKPIQLKLFSTLYETA